MWTISFVLIIYEYMYSHDVPVHFILPVSICFTVVVYLNNEDIWRCFSWVKKEYLLSDKVMYDWLAFQKPFQFSSFQPEGGCRGDAFVLSPPENFNFLFSFMDLTRLGCVQCTCRHRPYMRNNSTFLLEAWVYVRKVESGFEAGAGGVLWRMSWGRPL